MCADGTLLGADASPITQLDVAIKNKIKKVVVAANVEEELAAVVQGRYKRFGGVEVVGCQEMAHAIEHIFDL